MKTDRLKVVVLDFYFFECDSGQVLAGVVACIGQGFVLPNFPNHFGDRQKLIGANWLDFRPVNREFNQVIINAVFQDDSVVKKPTGITFDTTRYYSPPFTNKMNPLHADTAPCGGCGVATGNFDDPI